MLKKLMVIALALLFTSIPVAAYAAPFEAYLYDRVRWGVTVPSINGYVPDTSFSGQSLGIGAFSSPSDLFVTQDGLLYIADTGNHRIVVVDISQVVYEVTKVIYVFHNPYTGEYEPFNRPQGVFVTPEGYLYIADTNNGRVVALDPAGNTVRIIGEPVSELITEHFIYRPRKLAVDRGGRVFVVAEATTEGLIQFSSQGEFIGFFGGNRVSPNFAEIFLRIFLSAEQRARRSILVPIEYSNVHIDANNFIYTTTVRQTENQVKRLNFMGMNILRHDGATGVNFGDLVGWTGDGHSIVDVTVDEFDNFTILDSSRGRLYQYNQLGELMFVMGGIGDSLGLFRNPVALGQFEGRLFVLDSTTNDVTTFVKNEFGALVHRANNAFFAGDYETAAEGWHEVLRLNVNFGLAYVGLGHEAMRQRDYHAARYYFRQANHRTGYSRAFREVRNDWLRRNFTLYSTAIIIFTIVFMATAQKRKNLYKKINLYFQSA